MEIYLHNNKNKAKPFCTQVDLRCVCVCVTRPPEGYNLRIMGLLSSDPAVIIPPLGARC